MIATGRLEGSLDQVGQYLYFKNTKNPIDKFDEGISKVCNKLNDLCGKIQNK